MERLLQDEYSRAAQIIHKTFRIQRETPSFLDFELSIGVTSMRLSFLTKSLFPRGTPTTARPLAGIMRSFVNSTIMFLLVFSVIRWLLLMVKDSNP